jgi:positive regulator of sigma E activity
VFAADFVTWIVALSPVLVATIGGLLAWLVKRFERRNDSQHAENQVVLVEIRDSVHHLSQRIDGHLEWHAERKDTQ